MSLKGLAWRVARRITAALEPPPPEPPRPTYELPPPENRRFVPDATRKAEIFLDAARRHVAGRDAAAVAWLYSKPYDPPPGNPAFFYESYQLLNLLQAMRLPHRGSVLEPGCGPGWISESLVLLGLEVMGIDPAPPEPSGLGS
jgi:hypothetical protein